MEMKITTLEGKEAGSVQLSDAIFGLEPRSDILQRCVNWQLAKQFGKLGVLNALIIDGAEIEVNFRTAARNIPNIDVLPVQGINVYDILRRKTLVLTKAALDALEARFK